MSCPATTFRRRRPSNNGSLLGVTLHTGGEFTVAGACYEATDGFAGLLASNGLTVSKIPGSSKPLIFCDVKGSVQASRVFTRNQWRPSNGYAAVCKQPRKLPKQSWWDRAMANLSNEVAWWLDFENAIPGLPDIAKFKADGTIEATLVGGTKQTIRLSRPLAPVELEFSGIPTGWSISVEGKRCVTLRSGDRRIALKFEQPGDWQRMAVLRRAELKKDLGNFLLLPGGDALFPTAKPRPFVVSSKQKWTVHLNCVERLDSLGNGWLEQTDSSGRKSCFYFLSGKWYTASIPEVSYYAPVVLTSKQLQASVAGGAIQLFADGTASILGQVFYQDQDIDVLGPGGLHVQRDVSKSDWIYAIDDLGTEQAGVFSPEGCYWCWGGPTSSPNLEASAMKTVLFYFLLVVAVGMGWLSGVEPIAGIARGMAIIASAVCVIVACLAVVLLGRRFIEWLFS